MRIHLGTAQFGMPYGVTNTSGRVDIMEVKKIMSSCEKLRIEDIDTAHDYGIAEEVLGRVATKRSYRIASKITLGNASGNEAELRSKWDAQLMQSLRRLRRSKLHSLLVHDSRYFQSNNAKIAVAWLESVKERGLAELTGASIYDPIEIDFIPEATRDVIQLPISIYNQRAITDQRVIELAEMGKVLIARSVFFQGLLLKTASEWPQWMPSDLILRQKRLELFCLEQNKTLMEACLEFIATLDCLSGIAIGVCSQNELEEISRSMPVGRGLSGVYETWDASQSPYSDPRHWPTT